MFRLAMSHLLAILTYCFDQTVIINQLFGRSNKFKWHEDDSLLVETCSHMKYIYIYIYGLYVYIDYTWLR
jgi:hypothetical protein